jgi:hypothetical protein
MTCAEVREILLTAEIGAVGAPEGPLADHLAGCSGCRLASERILTAHAALQGAVARPPRVSASVASHQAMIAGAATVRSRRLRRRLAPALLATAAATAVLIVSRDRMPASTITPVTQVSLPPLVEGGSDRIAVITTGRPDITVVWQF